MRTLFQLPNLLRNGLTVGSLTLLAAAPSVAAELASSVSFVDRAALTSTSGTGWRANPLRAGSSTTTEENGLRQGVVPASYEDESAEAGRVEQTSYTAGRSSRTPQGLQLRPRSKQTGMLSSWFGETAKPGARTAPTQLHYKPLPPKSAAQQAMSMMPQFRSTRGQQRAAATATGKATPGSSRAGSALQRSVAAPSQRPGARSNMQTSFSTAASAQEYRPQTSSGRQALVSRQPLAPNQSLPHLRPSQDSSQSPRVARHAQTNTARPSTTPIALDGGHGATSAAVLTEAHKLAETARTEADFSNVFALCQQIPASQATEEEAAFGRQLAAWALNRRGQLRARAGNKEAAMSDFDTAIRVDAKCWRALHNRGVLSAQAGQFESAFDDFHRTIELNPNFAKAFSNRAALYVLAGELEPALADYEQAIALDPNLAIAHRGCGRVCHLLGRIDEALDHLSTAIKLAPQDATALASRGDLLTDLGEYAAAANDYGHALAANPKSADACRGSAWLLATCPDDAIRDSELALRRAELALRLERKADVATLDTLAAAQANAGDFAAATQTIRRAIELAPPSERSVYQDRMQMYHRSQPYRIAPLGDVQQVGYEQ